MSRPHVKTGSEASGTLMQIVANLKASYAFSNFQWLLDQAVWNVDHIETTDIKTDK